MENKILTGNEAKEVLAKLSEHCHPYPEPYVSGYFKSDEQWVAFDNTTNDCWTESFGSEKLARRYCECENEEELLELDNLSKTPKTKSFVITLTRTIEDIDKESAVEKFQYELENALYDSDSIEIEEEKRYIDYPLAKSYEEAETFINAGGQLWSEMADEYPECRGIMDLQDLEDDFPEKQLTEEDRVHMVEA